MHLVHAESRFVHPMHVHDEEEAATGDEHRDARSRSTG
jgi:hypothetical protein